jgi:tRNA1Val (adenine37-N6)-methyltransferase
MGRNNWFQFKQFKIIQERAAMKVGTDGVLLGAWANVAEAIKVLDVGTGTGLIALMIAQRSHAKITGIEIEKKAAEEAAENAQNSLWSNRIKIQNISFQEFKETTNEKFDLVISNPPFFTNSQRSKCDYLAMAKHNHLLPFAVLANGAEKLLEQNGNLAVILPVEAVRDFTQIALNERFFMIRQTEVRSNRLKKVHRYLLEFSKTEKPLKKDFIYIHTDDNSDFTEQYKILTRDFYLNF